MRKHRWIGAHPGRALGVLLAFVVPTSSFPSRAATLSVSSTFGSETRLQLEALVEKEAVTASGVVELVATEQLELEVLGLSEEKEPSLRVGRGEALRVGRDQVVLDPASLDANKKTKVTISIRDLDRPGRFRGTIELAKKGELAAIASVSIELVVDLKPAFALHRGDQTTLALVNCNRWTCPLAGSLVPGGRIRKVSTRVDNESPAAIEVSAKGWLRRTPGDVEIDLVSSPKTKIGPAGFGTVELPIDGKLAPGTYEGSLFFTAAAAGPSDGGSDAAADSGPQIQLTTVPSKLTIHVRAGPVWPIILILLGILLGRIALSLGRPETKLKIALFPRLVGLEDASARIRHPASRIAIDRKLRDLRRRIARAQGTEAEIGAELDTVADQIDSLQEADGLEAQILESALSDAEKKALQANLESARTKIVEGKPADAAKEIDNVRVALETGQIEAPARRAAAMVTDLQTRAAAPKEPRFRKLRSAMAGTLSVLSGTGDEASLETIYWLWRPLLFVFLLAALTIQGLLLLYAGESHQTFGSQGLADYAPLLLWGVGTDVANRTLQQISLPGRS